MDLENIKLVIWDLDETFWSGTISEENIIPIEQNMNMVIALSDMGVINTINSKNDREVAERKLAELGVKDYFVFPSISWEPKGQRVREQISTMKLRPDNVLFIDDNSLMLEEVRYYNPGITVMNPNELDSLAEAVRKADKKDPEHTRLTKYKIMETKYQEQQTFSSNIDFLRDSDIQININRNCMKQINRIHEMILRTNQLNFTKKRITKDELCILLNDETVDTGFISVSDKYGEYGVIGFFAVKNFELEHFLFSCQMIGMGIEQYVYADLGYPEIRICGDVAETLTLDPKPDWIKTSLKKGAEKTPQSGRSDGARILFKGPCDLSQIFSYMKQTDHTDCEFTYINQDTGVSIEQHNHTCHIVNSLNLNRDRQDMLINELPFSDRNMFSNKIFREKYDIVFLSLLTDGNLGVYKRKGTGELIAFGEYRYPVTDRANWDDYINGTIFSANCVFTSENLKEFSDKYMSVGRISVSDMIENLEVIRKNLDPQTILALMLGVEMPYEANRNPAYEKRHTVHKEMNDAVRTFAVKHDNVEIIDFNHYVTKQSDFYNNINHFIKPVYYNVSKDIADMIDKVSAEGPKIKPKYKLYFDRMKQIAKKMLQNE